MAFLLENAFNGSDFVNSSSKYPQLRMYTSKKINSNTPLDEQPQVEEQWAVSSPSAVSMNIPSLTLGLGSGSGSGSGLGDDNWLYMSAVCYLYGMHIHAHTKKPVGLVNTNWGVSEKFKPTSGCFV